MDPQTALALFIAPVLLDAAFDFPVGAARNLWRPLAILAVGAVLATTAAVAWLGVAVAGLPVAAAVALGAIVAPPDAAAATAVLGSVSIPKRTVAVLKGESLFNDATALLLFGGALAVQANHGFGAGDAFRLAVAAPGGLVFGIAMAFLILRIGRFVAGTLGGSILQFVNAYAVWILAEHLGLSAVLAVVACAMTIARSSQVANSARVRVHSFAVWATVVFLLNVLAFLLMGMQARMIVEQMSHERLSDALATALAVIVVVILVRIVLVLGWIRLAARFDALRGDLPRPSVGQGVFVAWRAFSEATDRTFRRLHGRKRLIIGNHDRQSTRALPWAEPPAHLAVLKEAGSRIVLCHYGLRVWPSMHHGTISLYGHSHGRLPGHSRALDVGVDNWDFFPVSIDQIRERLATLPAYTDPEIDL